MTADADPPERLSLKRWSRRKLEAAHAKAAPASPPAAPAPVAAPLAVGAAPSPAAPASVATLPPVESLTIESDFAPFLKAQAGETLKRQALKQLFRDPHFNVMDGLDVYVGDYSIPDPIAPEIVKQMVQGRYIFDPPATRVNAQGHVEDVPPEDAARGGPADPGADASGEPVPPGTPETHADPASLQPSAAQAPGAGMPAPRAPRESPVGAAPLPDRGMPEPPTR